MNSIDSRASRKMIKRSSSLIKEYNNNLKNKVQKINMKLILIDIHYCIINNFLAKENQKIDLKKEKVLY